MNKKRLVFICFIFLLITAGVVLKFKRRSQEKIKTAVVIKKDLVQTISASGKVKSEKEVVLKFQTSGKLAWVGVKEGDYVKKWQAIASLDKKELKKKFQKYANDYLKERWDFEQTKEDYKETLITNEIKRILDKAQFDLNKAVLDYEIADLAVKYATIYSPIKGIVTKVDSPVAGVNITPATATFIIADPEAVYFEADVDEVDVGGVKEDQPAILNLDAYPQEEIKTTVYQVGFQAKTTRGGGTAFPVKIKLPDNKDQKFKLGMNGDVDIIINKKEDILVAPLSALIKRKGKYYVFLVKNGVAQKQEVQIGLKTDEEVEIVKGLRENDRIVIEKLSQIKNGQKIK